MLRVTSVLLFTTFFCLKLYSQSVIKKSEPTYYLDSAEFSELPIFDVQFIDSIYVGKKVGTNGQIFISTKRNHKFNWLSISSIAANYPKFKTLLFMINDKFIELKKNTQIDSSYILKIEELDSEDLFVIGKRMKKMRILNIVTKTKENIEKSKYIRIRGSGE